MDNTFAKAVRHAMAEDRISASKIHRDTGIARCTIWRLAKGHWIHPAIMSKLANYLGIRFDIGEYEEEE